jgi:hypothetical protein
LQGSGSGHDGRSYHGTPAPASANEAAGRGSAPRTGS